MATAQQIGANSLTKVLESICRERRREHLDKESEGKCNVPRIAQSCHKPNMFSPSNFLLSLLVARDKSVHEVILLCE